MLKLFQFTWDQDYGGGLCIVAAKDIDEACEIATNNSRWWSYGMELSDCFYNGEPCIITSDYYQE